MNVIAKIPALKKLPEIPRYLFPLCEITALLTI
jgi:hypothetical protein